jgi:hypothetical protein
MNKTLIGKNGYLFLQNDSARELEIHNNNLCLVAPDFYKRYEPIKNKFLLVVFPNKPYIYSKFLPDNYIMIFRPAFDLYNYYLNEHIMDGYSLLKDVDDTFFKTDTHINNNGALIIYNEFIKKINALFKMNIDTKTYECKRTEVNDLSSLGLGIGDLTWSTNLGDQTLETTKDTYYEIIGSEQLYSKYVLNMTSEIKLVDFDYANNNVIDKTSENIYKTLDWNIISKYSLFKKNTNANNKYKVVIFYDSFLCSTLQLYMNLFYEIYCIKSVFNIYTINIINPDYVFEFRAERFLF